MTTFWLPSCRKHSDIRSHGQKRHACIRQQLLLSAETHTHTHTHTHTASRYSDHRRDHALLPSTTIPICPASHAPQRCRSLRHRPSPFPPHAISSACLSARQRCPPSRSCARAPPTTCSLRQPHPTSIAHSPRQTPRAVRPYPSRRPRSKGDLRTVRTASPPHLRTTSSSNAQGRPSIICELTPPSPPPASPHMHQPRVNHRQRS